MARRKRQLTPLLPIRHTEPDLFVCDILDAAPKGDQASMQHPLFSLSVKKDMQTFEYEKDGAKLEITPSKKEGRANVFDRDIVIYVMSQLMAAKDDGRTLSRRVRICAYDLLKATNRHTSGQAYATLKRALTRLQFTQIETNIHNNDLNQWRSISFITDAKIITKDSTGQMIDVELEIGEWLLDAIEKNNVLTLNKEYFRLRKPLERRLYELARKHCGNQPKWQCGLKKLQLRSGSTSTDKEFKRMVKAICDTDKEESHMPDYHFILNNDTLEVRPKSEFQALYAPSSPDLFSTALVLRPETHEKARTVARGWDIYMLESEWREWMSTKEPPKNLDAAFIAFCRRKGKHPQVA